MNLSVLERMASDGDLSVSALRYLLDARGECERLDFKESLALSHDAANAEFSRDCLAMKNVGGGYLVIGVRDKTWERVGLTTAFPYDSKLIKDAVRRCTGLDLDIHSVSHTIAIDNLPRTFAIILIRGPRKRSKRRVPSIVQNDFRPTEKYGLRRGDIFIRDGDSTVRVTGDNDFERLLDQLNSETDEDALELGQSPSPFQIELGTYRLLEPGFETYIGRLELRKQLLSAVEHDPRVWIINVHGPGGVGKSALVNWVAHHCFQERVFEAILQLTAKDTMLTASGIRRFNRCLYSLDDLLDRILETFQESTELPLSEKQALATEYLSAWSTLLVLDNMETVQDGRILDFVQNLPTSNRCKVVLTSRTRSGGWELPIAVHELGMSELREFSAAKSLEMHLELPEDESFFAGIRDATGGLPLAVQWVLGQLRHGGRPEEVFSSVRSAGSPVLEFSFRNIWQRLSADARAVMVALTVFDQPPTLQGLCIACQWDQDRVERAIEDLSDVTLVNSVRRNDGKSVFVALPITLSFARNEAQEFGAFERECQQRVNRYDQEMKLQDAEVRRFAASFERYGLSSNVEKKAAILCSRGQAELFGGNVVLADSMFKEARETAPDSAYVLAMSASYELARNRIGVATEFAKRACGLATRSTGHLAYTVLARVYDVCRNRGAVIVALSKALEFEADNVVTRHKYGVALSRDGKPEEAIDQFSAIIASEQSRDIPGRTLLMALHTRALNLRRCGRLEEARADGKMAREIIAKYPFLSDQAYEFAEDE